MANKKTKKDIPLKSDKQLNYILISILAVLLAGAAVITIFVATRDPAARPEDEVKSCNLALTKRALAANLISEDEIVLLDKAVKTEKGDTKATFHIFKVVDGKNAKPFMGMRSSEALKESQLELVGSGNAIFVQSNLAMIDNMHVSHNQ